MPTAQFVAANVKCGRKAVLHHVVGASLEGDEQNNREDRGTDALGRPGIAGIYRVARPASDRHQVN